MKIGLIDVVYACLRRLLTYHPDLLEMQDGGGYHNKGYRLKEEEE